MKKLLVLLATLPLSAAILTNHPYKPAPRDLDENCAICLCEMLKDEVIVAFDCDPKRKITHKYHLNCAAQGLERSKECAMCRRTLKLLNHGNTNKLSGDHCINASPTNPKDIALMNTVCNKAGFAPLRARPADEIPEEIPGLFEKESLREMAGGLVFGLLAGEDLKRPSTSKSDFLTKGITYLCGFCISQVLMRKVNPERSIRKSLGSWTLGTCLGLLPYFTSTTKMFAQAQ